jgi:flagellar M-ring protein FliF
LVVEFINRSVETISEFFGALSPGRKIAFVGILLGLMVAIGSLFFWASRTSYTSLVTNLTPEDSTAVIRYLREKRIPFIVDESGRSVSVPPEKVYDLRLELASSGLAQSGVVGYEVFDKQSFGATSTVQRINEQRALKGELVRTINHIKGVERSRVHLAIPQKSAFLSEDQKPTASVILDLLPSANLGEDQVRGMQRLVASAVKGLDLNAVTIVSNSGKLLSQNTDDPEAAFAAANMDYQRKFEQKLEAKVVNMLGTAVGEGKAKAMINADFDFSRVSESQTIYDGENTAIRSTDKDNDVMSGVRPLPSGQPGVRAQVPGAENQIANNPVASNNTQRNRERVNYEVPQTVKRVEKPMATLKRLSVSVMVDAVAVPDAAAPGGVKYEPLSEAKLAEFRSIVANAVGWDKDRDPPIEVKSIAFFKEDLDAATAAAELAERNKMIANVAKWAAIGLMFTLFFLFVVRPFIKWVTENTVDSVEDFLPQTLEELEKVQSKQVAQSLEDILPEIEEKVDPEKVQSEMLKEKVMSLVNDNPHKASQILHEWIIQKPADKGDNSKTA